MLNVSSVPVNTRFLRRVGEPAQLSVPSFSCNRSTYRLDATKKKNAFSQDVNLNSELIGLIKT